MMQQIGGVTVLLSVLFMSQWSYFIAVGNYTSNSTKPWPPTNVKIGALLAFNTTIGEFAQRAIQLAVQDINTENALNGTQLELLMYNTGCRPIQGAASAVELLKESVVAIVGPQASAVSQFVAHIGRETTIPFVSFAATDPNFSEMQYSYFFRIAPSDALQMEAVAAFVANYGWRGVVMFHMDDDYGTNGASSLSYFLQLRGSSLVDKVAFAPDIDKSGIDNELARLVNRQSRIFIVHTTADVALSVLHEAYYLNMMVHGYVWIVTDIVTTALGYPNLAAIRLRYTQNIIGVRRYIAQSSQLNNFLSAWKKSLPSSSFELDASQLNAYMLYAYDAVWAIALAISSYLNEMEDIEFVEPSTVPNDSGGQSELAKMRIFKGGPTLRNYILKTNFVGASGFIKFDELGDLAGAAFEYINMVGRSPHVVGYWRKNNSGVSLSPPGIGDLASEISSADYPFLRSHGATPINSTSMAIIWPGGSILTPRGWVLPKNGRPLRIGVPRKAGYKELVRVTVDAQNVTTYSGFCIQVFETALKYLPYAVPYRYEVLGDGITTPEYNQLILKLAQQEYDGVVGDVSVLAERLRIADFTQPYLESGLVVLVSVRNNRENCPWAFFRPFKLQLWMTVLLLCIFTGSVIWILEHKVNQDFRGPPRTQLVTVLTFIFSTLFFTHREDTRSILGRSILIVWLFVILIITSSYTANLTSILTVEKLAPAIEGLETLIHSNLPIGYQTGSFVRDYLISLHVSGERLRPLSSRRMYQRALELGPHRGGVAAIVDELPYVQLFQQSSCKSYIIAGQEFTKSGWGFAFPRDSDITTDLSEAILQMSQSGELQHIKDYWFGNSLCEEEAESAEMTSSQLDLRSFWGLFLISGALSVACVFIHMIQLWKQFREDNQLQEAKGEAAPAPARKTGPCESLRKFGLFMDKSVYQHKPLKDSISVPPQPCNCMCSCPTTSSSTARSSTESM